MVRGETAVVNWEFDGEEVKAYIVGRYPYLNGKWEWVAKNPEYYFQEGAAYSAVTSGGLRFRWMPSGFICEHASNAIYLEDEAWSLISLTALFNSSFADYIVGLNETINVNIDDLLRMPVVSIAKTQKNEIDVAMLKCIFIRWITDALDEKMWGVVVPPSWFTGLQDLANAQARLSTLETQIDDEVYRLYGIGAEDRAAIEAELSGSGQPSAISGQQDAEGEEAVESEAAETAATMTRQELAVRWVSYAIGIVLGRFQPGNSPLPSGERAGGEGLGQRGLSPQ